MRPIFTRHRTIGLLGGSFNPAHAGHLHITLYALKTLKLDAVWWLVSPQNPLKSPDALAAYGQRLTSARRIAAPYRQIIVTDIEATLGTRYSVDTIALLQARHAATQFVWLMGADNLAQFHRWRRWRQLLAMLPIVVFDRAPYSHTALRSKTFLYARRFLRKNSGNTWNTPSLRFIHLKRSPLSSTALRKTLGKAAFLRHNR